MASTYVNDLRLEEIGSGEQSGTWGDTTNTNLELIAEAFSFGTEAITTNANTHTTTIADGATDPGRSLFLKYTGTLDSACTITLAPNTISKLWFIENGTSGSQNIIIKQGSGATITVPPGDTKAIYSNGGGSGAVMVDAFASLSVVDLKVQDDLTVTGLATIGETLAVTGIATFTDDIIIGDGKTIGSASTVGAITIASDGDITLSADLNVGANFDVTGNSVIDGTALVTGVLTTTAQAVFNGGFDGNAKATINTADGLSSDYALVVTNGETTAGQNFGMRVRGGSNASDVAFTVETYNNGSDLFRMYGNGQSSFHDGTAALPSITNIGDLNTGIFFPAADEIGFTDGGTEAARFSAAGQLFIKHTTNVATAGHNAALQLTGAGATDFSDATLSIIGNSANSNGSYLHFGKSRSNSAGGVTVVADDDTVGQINFCAADGADLASRAASITVQIDGTPSANDVPGRLHFATTADGAASPTNRMTILSGGNVGIGTIAPNEKLMVAGAIRSTSNATSFTGSAGALMDYNADHMRLVATDGSAQGVMSLGKDGNLDIADGNVVFADGHGIDFSSSTGGAGSVSQLLNRYDTGTWTPDLGSSVASSGELGFYTRIGNFVHIEGTITVASTTDSGHMQILGLPFTSLRIGGCFLRYSDFPTNIWFHINGSATSIGMYNANGSALVYSTLSGKRLDFVGSYTV